ncbi:MAG: N-acetylmuramoyl-L-alanine amidase [candidate division KSB1 bacterium]|nr:N-acetylmuramoyl-L-alanine amidase [candidate division KSB1 bacterium]
MAEALAVLVRLLVISTIVERFLEIASQIWDYLLQAGGKPRAEPGQKRIVLQTAGFLLGSLLALVMGVRVFGMLGIGGVPLVIDVLFTGILVGGGTEPVHSLIKFLEENKDRVKQELSEARARPETVLPEAGTIGISYGGGLYPDRPGHGLRRQNPDTIIYHHSATHLNTSFERIVEIERQRDLDPTYHCVVTADGRYHNYCRWDSIGWHAKGMNARSLGLCLVGNFHTDPSDPSSNADGRFGPSKPTEAQLDTAARILALWMLLYGIPEERIFPHRAVGKTNCPGSSFPEDQLLERARQYRRTWAESEVAQAELAELKSREGVYV